ncbi:MAG: ATP-grasp domain-containing protein [Bacillota bacterium]|nr:ATP-grasp domain-containing protein [Bacillota bacterium]
MKECEVNLLFTSSGRRVALIKKFQETLLRCQIDGKIVTTDLKNTAPSAFYSDRHYLVPGVTEKNYVSELLKICMLENIKLLIPLIDTELLILVRNKERFEEIGVKLFLSSQKLNELANDKIKTYEFFIQNNIPSPKVYSEDELKEAVYQFPLLIKPRDGSSSRGVLKIKNQKELDFFKEYIPNAMVQEFIHGTEFTVDVMLDFYGNIKTIVPRERIETRAGEVSKGITRKDFDLISATEMVIKKLPGAVGCITLQCFKKETGEITFIEINPRFGGGIPLSIEAGANFPLWTIEMLSGMNFKETDFSWKENLTMLRFDEAIFTENIGHEYKSHCI